MNDSRLESSSLGWLGFAVSRKLSLMFEASLLFNGWWVVRMLKKKSKFTDSRGQLSLNQR